MMWRGLIGNEADGGGRGGKNERGSVEGKKCGGIEG